MVPGAIMLTRIPCGPYRTARARVSDTRPALAALYASFPYEANAFTEPMLQMTPRCRSTMAGSSADTPLLDLIAANEALGNTAQADAYVKRIMANHDAEVEEDLPPRTAAILRRRRLYPPAA